MKSKTVERLQKQIKKDSWFTKLKRNLIVELFIIMSLGIIKYLTYKPIKNGKILNN